MPLLTVRAIDAHKARARPYKLTLDRGLQLRIAPDGVRTLLVRYTVKGSESERQHRLPQEYGEGSGQMKLAAACAEAARIRAMARVSGVGVIRPPGVGIYRPLGVAPKGISKHPVDGVILPR